MNQTQLQIFLNLVESRSYSATAKMLFISQSLVSYNIKNLEEELGFKLFDRNTHEVKLTHTGEIFAETVQVVDSMMSNVIRTCQAIDKSDKSITVGIIGNQFMAMATQLFDAFTKRYPGIDLSLVNCRFEDSIMPLIRHEVNFIYVFEREASLYSYCDYVPLFKCEPHALVSKNHKLAKRKQITLKELEAYTISFLESDNSGMLTYLKENAPNMNIRFIPNLNVELLSIHANKNIVLSPFSYGINNEMSIVSIPITDIESTTRGIAYNKNNTSDICQKFIKVLKEHELK